MKGPDTEIFEIGKNSTGYPATQSDDWSLGAGQFSGRTLTYSDILKVVAGLSCMALLCVVTLQTVFWSNFSESPGYGLPLVLTVSLISVSGIVVSRFWRLRVGK